MRNTAALTSLLALLSSPAFSQDATEDAEVLETVTVEGSQVEFVNVAPGGQVATGGRAGLLGNIEYSNLPFSGTAYTSQLAEDQQADGVGDVLINDPSVRVQKGFGNFQDVYQIRGFPVFSDDLTFNGLYGIVPRQFVAAPFVERVEVFRGVNTFINGAAPGNSAIGGTVNLVPKRAPDEGIRRVTLGYESDGTFLGTADFGERFGTYDEWGIRGVAVGRFGETAINDQDRDLAGLSFGIDYDGERLRFTADTGYQDNSIDRPRPQVTPTAAVPNPPDADANYAQHFTFSEEQQLFFMARGEYDITDAITVWAASGFRDGDEKNDLANPNSDADGNLTALRFVNVREDRILSGDAGIRAQFDTGPVNHDVVASASAARFKFGNAFAFSDFARFNAGTLSNPLRVAPPPTTALVGGNLSNPLTTEDTRTTSAAIADTLSFFDDRLLVTGGLRWQRIEQETFNATTGAREGDIEGHEITPLLGVVFKPTEQISVYGNYAQSLQRGAVAPQTVGFGGPPVTNAGKVLDPIVSDQYEVGVKFKNDKFGTNLSLFSITQQNTIFVGNTFTDSGEQRNQGIELSFYGEPVPRLRILGGATYIDPQLENTAGGVDEGNDAVGVPNFAANLGVEYDVPLFDGLTVDGRAIYTGSQFINTANTLKANSWTRFDLGVKIAGNIATLRGRVQNVFNQAYWASVGGFPGANYLVQGDPRTFSLSLTIDF